MTKTKKERIWNVMLNNANKETTMTNEKDAMTLVAKDGTEIEAGDWVVGGTGDGLDYGRVSHGDDGWLVSWTASTTPVGDGEDLTVYDSREAAQEEYERRLANTTEQLP